MRMPAFGHLVLSAGLISGFGAALCSCQGTGPAKDGAPKKEAAKAEESPFTRLDSYTVRGFTFTYFLIPAGLEKEPLIEAAQALHAREPKAQLILVDDVSQLKEYINYAKEFSRGNTEAPFPMEWAKAHVIANVQKFISGKYKLCRGVGVDEIVDLK